MADNPYAGIIFYGLQTSNNKLTEQEAEDGWILLFDGKALMAGAISKATVRLPLHGKLKREH